MGISLAGAGADSSHKGGLCCEVQPGDTERSPAPDPEGDITAKEHTRKEVRAAERGLTGASITSHAAKTT